MYKQKNYAEDMLSADMLAKIKAEGFGVEVSYADAGCYDSPRDWADSVWINNEVPVPADVDKGSCIDDFMKNYCRDILKCSIDDVIWSPVYRFEHGASDYSLTPFSCPWDSGLHGAIYIEKKVIRNIFGVSRINKAVRERAMKILANDVEAYSAWANNEIYEISILDNDGDPLAFMGGIYVGDTENMDSFAEDVLSEAVYFREPQSKQAEA